MAVTKTRTGLGLDWDWTGLGLGLDWEIYSLIHSCESLVSHVLQVVN